jgi:predicted RNA-binding Zn ribbon-like protein
METPLQIARNRIVGGDLALDFVNTLTGPPAGPPDDDALLAYDDLVLWARHVGQLDDRDSAALIEVGRRIPTDAAATFDRALAIRSDLHAVFWAVAHGEHAPASGLAALRTAETMALERARLVPDGEHLAWSWDHEHGLARPLWPVIHAAVELLTGGRLGRVKQCGGCRYLFVDASKNNSRRWCAMEDCGTAEKSKRFVARRRARAADARPTSSP